jgi:uncharacterized protein
MPTLQTEESVQTVVSRRPAVSRKIWIDLDNSPHVPFFAPIIEELENQGHTVLVTARDCFQVCDLADLLKVRYRRIGRHYGKNIFLKLAGLSIRALQVSPTVLSQKPDLAVSHGSRSQLLAAKLLGVPAVTIGDYEFSKLFAVVRPNWLIVPQVIPDDAVRSFKTKLLKYPGIKEDVYAPRFRPQASIVEELGLNSGRIIVTVRPPATEAHYHVPESDRLFDAVLDRMSERSDVKLVVLPRNQRQGERLRQERRKLFESGKAIIPQQVVDGLNLVWHSDLVISGGGTMNREAAALGVPVYSMFRGKIGAVDRYLVGSGRMTLLESVEDVSQKLVIRYRDHHRNRTHANGDALQTIVGHLVNIAEGTC